MEILIIVLLGVIILLATLLLFKQNKKDSGKDIEAMMTEMQRHQSGLYKQEREIMEEQHYRRIEELKKQYDRQFEQLQRETVVQFEALSAIFGLPPPNAVAYLLFAVIIGEYPTAAE